MLTKHKRILLASFGLFLALLCFGGGFRLATRTVAWARNFHIGITVDSVALSKAVEEAVRAGLHASDAATQLQVLNSLADSARTNEESRVAIRNEYAGDLETLTESSDTDVAENAASLLALVTQDE